MCKPVLIMTNCMVHVWCNSCFPVVPTVLIISSYVISLLLPVILILLSVSYLVLLTYGFIPKLKYPSSASYDMLFIYLHLSVLPKPHITAVNMMNLMALTH